MSEIVDDLLQEVKELESATKELEAASSSAKSHEHALMKKSTEHQNALQLLNIEAIKTAQNSAKLSQNAAEASLKQGQKLKSEIFEINEANFNWRQAIRNSAKDFKSVKSSVSIMLAVSIAFSLSAAGTAGYLVYKMQKQSALLEGEIVDIVTTEHALLKKDITLKIDELAAVIETMNYPQRTDSDDLNTQASEQQNTENYNVDIVDRSTNKVNTDSIQHNNAISDQGQHSNRTVELTEKNKNNDSTMLIAELDYLKSEVAQQSAAIKNNHHLLTELKTDISNIKATNPNTDSKSSQDNSKKLDSLSWLIRQQSKKVSAIEKDIAAIQTAPAGKQFDIMKLSLEKIQLQQTQLQKQLQTLDKSLEELTELSKDPPPYSYKAK